MKPVEISEDQVIILHEPVTEKIRVKDWLEIHLSLYKRKESAAQWLNDLGLSLDIFKKMSELKDIEWIGLQYLTASFNEPCLIYDSYDCYAMEEILFINRILKKVALKKSIQVFSMDKRLLFSGNRSNSYIKVRLSCRNFHAEKYVRYAKIHQEGDHLISYFENKEKAIRFMIKCLNQEDVYYCDMAECDEKTDI